MSRKIRVTAMDEDTAELLDESVIEVADNCEQVVIVADGYEFAELSLGKK